MIYIIPIFGKAVAAPSQWQFAMKAAGYRMRAYRRISTPSDLRICASSPIAGDVETITGEGDDLIIIDTNAPVGFVEALWAMCGQVCAFIGTTNSPVTNLDELRTVKITSTR